MKSATNKDLGGNRAKLCRKTKRTLCKSAASRIPVVTSESFYSKMFTKVSEATLSEKPIFPSTTFRILVYRFSNFRVTRPST